ncbi:MAG: SDR family oxidoreductase [Myxococcota bacterium]
MSTKRLEGRAYVVTGASRGIGRAIAARIVAEGGKVVLVSRKQPALEEVAAELGEGALPLACHTGSAEAIGAMIETAVERFGALHGLVNNAATNPYFGPLMNVEERAWDKTFDVNLKGYFACARGVVRHLLDSERGGSIVNVSSVLGTMAAPLQGVYGMTKAGVISMTQTLAAELGPKGVRVNAIAPGLVETKFAQVLVENAEIRKLVIDRTTLKRIGQPEDIAGVAAFLLSDDAAYLTGQTLNVDGGWTAT